MFKPWTLSKNWNGQSLKVSLQILKFYYLNSNLLLLYLSRNTYFNVILIYELIAAMVIEIKYCSNDSIRIDITIFCFRYVLLYQTVTNYLKLLLLLHDSEYNVSFKMFSSCWSIKRRFRPNTEVHLFVAYIINYTHSKFWLGDNIKLLMRKIVLCEVMFLLKY